MMSLEVQHEKARDGVIVPGGIENSLRTVLLVAAEGREFAGLLPHAANILIPKDAHAQFARDTLMNHRGIGERWFLLANGPGPKLVEQMLTVNRWNADLLISVGFCGALDPKLKLGDIVIAGDAPFETRRRYVRGEILSQDRVAVTWQEKEELFQRTGAAVVEMESAAVERKAREWNLPYLAIRVVSDTADDSLPLDFNRYRDRDGRFSVAKIALTVAWRPYLIQELLKLNRDCRFAADQLGDFLVDCTF